MRKSYFLSVVMFGLAAHSQTVSVISTPSNDLVYSTASGSIFASIPSDATANANTLVQVNPVTGALETTYPVGQNPEVMAVTDDGSLIYIGLKGTAAVQRFVVATGNIDMQFTLGNETISGDYYAEDIEVMPGNPNTVAVARRNHNFAPKHEGVAIYDNGVMRANVTRDHTGSNQIEFASATQIVGFNNETTEYKFKKINVSASGVAAGSQSNQPLPAIVGGASRFIVYGNRAFFTNGKTVDFSAAPVVGVSLDAFGPAIYDAANGAICYASYDMGGNISLKFFDATTLELINSIPIPQASGSVKNLVTCGAGYYAFNTADKIVVVNYALDSPDVSSDLMRLYPNPVADVLHIDGVEGQIAVALYNQVGQLVFQSRDVSAQSPIDLSMLASGSYIVRIESDAMITTKKLIKL